MLLSEFLQTRNQSIVSQPIENGSQVRQDSTPRVNSSGNSFADELRSMLESSSQVQFSNHAIKRLESREIDVTENDRLERLNRGVSLQRRRAAVNH